MSLTKFQHVFVIKVLENIGLHGIYLIIKAIYKKPTSNIITNAEKAETIVRNKL